MHRRLMPRPTLAGLAVMSDCGAYGAGLVWAQAAVLDKHQSASGAGHGLPRGLHVCCLANMGTQHDCGRPVIKPFPRYVVLNADGLTALSAMTPVTILAN